jgi:hypothetical protein
MANSSPFAILNHSLTILATPTESRSSNLGISESDNNEIINGATRGFRFVSIPRLILALDHAGIVRTHYEGELIDQDSGLRKSDFSMVTSAAALALEQAKAAARRKRSAEITSALFLVVAAIVIIGGIYLAIEP